MLMFSRKLSHYSIRKNIYLTNYHSSRSHGATRLRRPSVSSSSKFCDAIENFFSNFESFLKKESLTKKNLLIGFGWSTTHGGEVHWSSSCHLYLIAKGFWVRFVVEPFNVYRLGCEGCHGRLHRWFSISCPTISFPA